MRQEGNADQMGWTELILKDTGREDEYEERYGNARGLEDRHGVR